MRRGESNLKSVSEQHCEESEDALSSATKRSHLISSLVLFFSPYPSASQLILNLFSGSAQRP